MTETNRIDATLESQSSKSSVKFILSGVAAIGVISAIVAITQFPTNLPDDKPSHSQSVTEKSNPDEKSLDSQVDQAALQESLSKLKARVEDFTQSTAKMQWDTYRTETFKSTLDANYLAYGSGAYQKSKSGVEELNKALDDYEADYQSAYESKHQKAQSAFDKEDINTATIVNNETLAINPDFEPAKNLHVRLQVYPTVMDLLERMKQAEAEKDLDKQLNIVEQIAMLDPDRKDIQEQKKRIQNTVNNRDFANAIKDVYTALAQSNLDQAVKKADIAKSIYSDRPELKAVMQKISNSKKGVERASWLNKVDAAKQEDDWDMVRLLSQEGLSKLPNEPQLQSANRLAEQLIEARGYLQVYINKPNRLFDENIKKVAQEDLTNVEALTSHSASFAKMYDTVEGLLNVANTPISVWFSSDGDTYIRVLRVGEIGETDGRSVSLTPGIYEIEGRCKGYKTVIIPLEVLPNHDNQIHVVCNEKL